MTVTIHPTSCPLTPFPCSLHEFWLTPRRPFPLPARPTEPQTHPGGSDTRLDGGEHIRPDGGQIDLVPHTADDVEIGQGRFYHNDVGAFLRFDGFEKAALLHLNPSVLFQKPKILRPRVADLCFDLSIIRFDLSCPYPLGDDR